MLYQLPDRNSFIERTAIFCERVHTNVLNPDRFCSCGWNAQVWTSKFWGKNSTWSKDCFFSDVLFSANIYEAIYEALQGFVWKKNFFFAAIDYSRRHEVEMEEGSRLYLSSPFVFDHDEREENYIFQINSFLRIARILLIHQNNYKFVRLMDDIEVNTFYPYWFMQSKDDVIEVWKVNYEILKLTLFIAIDFM